MHSHFVGFVMRRLKSFNSLLILMKICRPVLDTFFVLFPCQGRIHWDLCHIGRVQTGTIVCHCFCHMILFCPFNRGNDDLQGSICNRHLVWFGLVSVLRSHQHVLVHFGCGQLPNLGKPPRQFTSTRIKCTFFHQ